MRVSRNRVQRAVVLAIVGVATGVALAGLGAVAPAMALETISLSEPLPDGEPGACPTLTQIKYPWLQCVGNAWGGTTLDIASQSDGWPESRRIPTLSAFTEGDGEWGPPSQ